MLHNSCGKQQNSEVNSKEMQCEHVGKSTSEVIDRERKTLWEKLSSYLFLLQILTIHTYHFYPLRRNERNTHRCACLKL